MGLSPPRQVAEPSSLPGPLSNWQVKGLKQEQRRPRCWLSRDMWPEQPWSSRPFPGVQHTAGLCLVPAPGPAPQKLGGEQEGELATPLSPLGLPVLGDLGCRPAPSASASHGLSACPCACPSRGRGPGPGPCNPRGLIRSGPHWRSCCHGRSCRFPSGGEGAAMAPRGRRGTRGGC